MSERSPRTDLGILREALHRLVDACDHVGIDRETPSRPYNEFCNAVGHARLVLREANAVRANDYPPYSTSEMEL